MKKISLVVPLLCIALNAAGTGTSRSATLTCGYIQTSDTLSTVASNWVNKTKSYSWESCPVGAAQALGLLLSPSVTVSPSSYQAGLSIRTCNASSNAIFKLVVTPVQTVEQVIEVTSTLGYKDSTGAYWNGANGANKKKADGSYDGFWTPSDTSLKTGTSIKGNSPYTIMWVESCGGVHTFNLKAK